jgi:uncharacterized protein YggE
MKKIITFLITTLVVIHSFSQTKNFIDQPYLETRAKVDTLVTPDRIYLTILIAEKDTKGKVSVEEFENRMAAKLTLLGIDLKKQLTVSDLTSNFKKYFLKRQDVLKSKAYTLLVYDAFSAGKVFVGLEEIGISNVHFHKAEYSKIEALKLSLKAKAVRKAQQEAIALLAPLNQKVGGAIYISDINTYNVYPVQARALSMEVAYDKKYEPIDIEFQKIKVQSEINIKFKIE